MLWVDQGPAWMKNSFIVQYARNARWEFFQGHSIFSIRSTLGNSLYEVMSRRVCTLPPIQSCRECPVLRGPRRPALPCRFPSHIAFGSPCGWCRPPPPHGVRCAGIVNHQSTWLGTHYWAGAGSHKQSDPANVCQGPILVPVCHVAGELNRRWF